jgi:3-deoxy-D-manno-octulosonic-acid transferase
MLSSFHTIFVQNVSSFEILKKYGLANNVIPGRDTRFDRVIEICEASEPLPKAVIDFCEGKKVIVAGSTWPDDEKVLLHYTKVHPEIKFIIAPHEIQKENMLSIEKYFDNPVFYSTLHNIENVSDRHILIIDNIGMLSRLYKVAHITYIGGGFGNDGIHNILEAAVYGKPVIFGPVYEKFAEAKELVARGGAFSIQDALELEALLDELFDDNDALLNSSNEARDYVYQQRGATRHLMDYIEEKRLLTN